MVLIFVGIKHISPIRKRRNKSKFFYCTTKHISMIFMQCVYSKSGYNCVDVLCYGKTVGHYYRRSFEGESALKLKSFESFF